jgi:hypothetical protein
MKNPQTQKSLRACNKSSAMTANKRVSKEISKRQMKPKPNTTKSAFSIKSHSKLVSKKTEKKSKSVRLTRSASKTAPMMSTAV